MIADVGQLRKKVRASIIALWPFRIAASCDSPKNGCPLAAARLESRVLFSASPFDPTWIESGEITDSIHRIDGEGHSAAAAPSFHFAASAATMPVDLTGDLSTTPEPGLSALDALPQDSFFPTPDESPVLARTQSEVLSEPSFAASDANSYSTATESRGSQNAIARDQNGNYVTVWSELGRDGDGWGVFARRFQSDGTAISAEVQINESDSGDQQWASVASDDVGNFVVTWTSDHTGDTDVLARIMDSNASPLSSEFRVNQTTAGDQKDSAIAINRSTGEFVITWEGSGPGDNAGIFFQQFQANGTAKRVGDQLANQTDRDDEHDPAIAMRTNNQFVIGWDAGQHVYFELFDAAGNPEGVDERIDGFFSTSSGLAVDSDAMGNFTFVYREEAIATGVWGKGFTEAGAQNYGYFRIGNSDAVSPSIGMANDGSFAVVWHEETDADGTGILGRTYQNDGSPDAAEFLINIDETGNQRDASIALEDVENYHVVWTGDGPAEANGPVISRASTANTPPVADDESLTVDEAATANETNLDDGTNLLDGDTDSDTGDTLVLETVPVAGPAHGALSLQSNGTFTYTHDGTENFTDSFTYRVNDGNGGTDTAVVDITITPINDNSPNADDETFTVNRGTTATEADLDDGTDLLDGDTDADLNDTLTVDIVPVTGPVHGVLTLQANGTFSYVHDGGLATADAFSYRVSDAAGNSATATVLISINVNNSNNPPVADDESFFVAEGATANEANLDEGTNLLDGDTDSDSGDTLVLETTPVAGPAHGTLTLQANGTFTYTHDDSENFTDSFTYRVNDGNGGTDTAVVNITITPINDNAPNADDETFTIGEGGTANESNLDSGSSLLDGDNDEDVGDTLVIDTTPVVAPEHGSLQLQPNGSFTYIHDDTENFTDSFTYQVTDAANNVSTGVVSITIVPRNDNGPVADNEQISVIQGGVATEGDLAVGTSLLDGDTDADLPSDVLVIDTTPTVAPAHGSLVLNSNGTFTYTHDGSSNLTDSFTYAVIDALGNEDFGQVAITVAALNQPPTAISPLTISVPEGLDTTGGVPIATLTGTDPDPGEVLSYSIQPGGDAGFFSIGGLNGDTLFLNHGILDFETEPSFSIVVRATDTALNTLDETIAIHVVDQNEPPRITLLPTTTSISEAYDTNSPTEVAVIQIDDDALGVNQLRISGSDAQHFEISGDRLHLRSGVELDYEVAIQLEIIVSVDDLSIGSAADDSVAFAVDITNIDESPIAVDDSYTVEFETELTIVTGVLANDRDPENSAIAATIVVAPTSGTLALNPDGSFSYRPAAGFVGKDRFVYQASDGTAAPSLATVSLDVAPVIVPPPPSESAVDERRENAPATKDNTDADSDEQPQPLDQLPPATPQPSQNRSPKRPQSIVPASVGLDAPNDVTLGVADVQVATVPIDATTARFNRNRSANETAELTFQVTKAFSEANLKQQLQGFQGLRNDIAQDQLLQNVVIGSSLAATTSLSVGYVIWLIRGGLLMSSVLSSLPAWQFVDPLPVLGSFHDNDTEDDDDDSLSRLVSRSATKHEKTP